jgi:hypothetical protein
MGAQGCSPMNPDFLDIIRALLDDKARLIIVGAYALNVYIDPRATQVIKGIFCGFCASLWLNSFVQIRIFAVAVAVNVT